jgi:hypothetical protein
MVRGAIASAIIYGVDALFGAARLNGQSGRPDGDIHSIESGLAELANIVDNAKCLGLLRLNNSGGGASIQRLQNILGDLCSRLDDLSRKIDITFQSLDGLINTMQGLPIRKAPIVLMEKEAGEGSTCPPCSSKKDREGGAADMSDAVHMNGDR